MDELGRILNPGGAISGRDRNRRLEAAVARLAAGQHDVVAARQLLEAGFSRRRIRSWLIAGRLRRIWPGVYATGNAPLSQSGRWMAAVLACGPEALLSHLSAAVALKMREASPIVIDVTAPRGRARRPGIRLHRPSLPPPAEERRLVEAIPLTSPARTFLDCAALLGDWALAQMLSAAEREGYFAPADLAARMPASARGRPGMASARRVLGRYVSAPGVIRTGLEQRFRQICAEHGPPLPRTNVFIADYEVDFVWDELMLIVETDGGPWHSTVVDRDKDARRDAVHRALGFEVARISDTQMERPADIASWLAVTLDRLVAA